MNFRHLPETYRSNYDRDIANDFKSARDRVSAWMKGQVSPLRGEMTTAREAKDATTYHRASGRLAVFGAPSEHLYDEQEPDSLRVKADALDALAQQRHDEGNRRYADVYAIRCQASALREVAAEWERHFTELRTSTDEEWRREDAEYGGEDPDALQAAPCTARQVAEKLGVSLSTIYRRCRNGLLAAVKNAAGRWIITVPAA